VLCTRVVRRGSQVVKAAPEGCLYAHREYTETVELPTVRVVAEGPDWKAETLEETDIYVQYKKVFDELDKCFSKARCKLLLYGPPGTGKSYAAKYFAKKWGVKLYVFGPGSLLSKYLGETEENIRRALDLARQGDAVLLDEFEIFAMSREKTSEMKLATVQVLLTELQELDNGVVIATTNADPSLIDPALRRGGRLKPVAVPLPTREMLETYARLKGLQPPPAEGVQNFTEVEDPRESHGTEWYYLLPPLLVPKLEYTIHAGHGVYRATWGATQEVALSLLWFYFSGRRQVWWLRKPRSDYTYVVDMADSYGAVVFVDSLIAADVVKFLRPPKRALFVFYAPVPGVYMPPLPATLHTYAASLEEYATKIAASIWTQLRPGCRSAEDSNTVVKAVWSSC
jgi:hypothetical protein